MFRRLINKRILKRVFFVTLFFGLLQSFANAFPGSELNLGLFLYSFYSSLLIDEIPAAIRVILLPVILCALVSDCFYEDYKIITYYGFQRVGGRMKWLRYKYAELCVYTAVSAAIYTVLNYFVLSIFYGSSLNENISIAVYIEAFVLMFFFLLLCTTFSNVLSLLISSKWSFIILTALTSAAACSVKYISTIGLMKLNPVANYMYTYHIDEPRVCADLGLQYSIGFLYSAIYFVMLLALLQIVGYVIITKSEPGLKK